MTSNFNFSSLTPKLLTPKLFTLVPYQIIELPMPATISFPEVD
jgi:hypothetical protein